MLGDYSDVVDAPATGEYDMYPAGGTKLADVRQSVTVTIQ